MISILIDTNDRNKSIIELQVGDALYKEVIESEKPHSEMILVSIEKVCKNAKISPSDIEEITVATGPGSYTGLRVGVSIANALALGSGARVNGKKIGILAEPHYS